MINLTIDEFLNGINSGDVPEMQSSVYTNIVRFFNKFSQDDIYYVTGNVKDVLAVFDGCAEIYNRFGIKHDSSLYKGHTVLNMDKEYILFIDEHADIPILVSTHISKYGKSPEYAVILTNNAEKNSCIVNTLASIIPNCCVMNKVVVENADVHNSIRDTVNYNYVDITEHISSAWRETVDRNADIASLVQLVENIRSLPHDSRTIFYLAEGAPASLHEVFIRIAVILTYEGLNFEIRPNFRDQYLRLMLNTLEQSNMLLGDYLYKLAHPITFGFYQQGDFGYTCLLDHRPGEAYDILDLNLRILETPLNSERLCLCNRSLTAIDCYYSQIEILDPIELFDLENMETNPEDYYKKSKAVENNIALNNLLVEFEEIVTMNIKLKNDMTLNFSNVLFYKREGQLYLGYVPRMPDVKYRYILLPLCNKYGSFKQTFNRADYDRLFDINILVEKGALFEKLGKFTYNTMRHFKKPRFLNGLLLGCFKTTAEILTASCKLTLPEVGIWSIQSQNGRTTALSFLLQRFNRLELHRRRFLSFWGGCNPMDITTLNVNYKIWRSDLDE